MSTAITAVGLHPFGRFEGKSVVDIGAEAVQSALAAAGVGPGGFEAAFCATVYSGVAAGHRVLSSLGLTGIPIVNVEAGCASGGAALRLGMQAIRSANALASWSSAWRRCRGVSSTRASSSPGRRRRD